MSSLALRLPLLEGARFAAAGVQVPCALLLLPGRPLLCSSAQTTHWSLSSSLSTLDFPVLWGSLGGIFGLEGGEPDLLLTQLRPDREGTEGKWRMGGMGEDAGWAREGECFSPES